MTTRMIKLRQDADVDYYDGDDNDDNDDTMTTMMPMTT